MNKDLQQSVYPFHFYLSIYVIRMSFTKINNCIINFNYCYIKSYKLIIIMDFYYMIKWIWHLDSITIDINIYKLNPTIWVYLYLFINYNDKYHQYMIIQNIIMRLWKPYHFDYEYTD